MNPLLILGVAFLVLNALKKQPAIKTEQQLAVERAKRYKTVDSTRSTKVESVKATFVTMKKGTTTIKVPPFEVSDYQAQGWVVVSTQTS
jgi:hypothetical protein